MTTLYDDIFHITREENLVMVRALEPARLSSNRVSINALARILPGSTRLESASTQLNSARTRMPSSMSQIESIRAKKIQYNILFTLRQGPLLLFGALQSYYSNEY